MTFRADAGDWKRHLLESPDAIRALLGRVRRVAVLGIKPETHADRPAFFVPEYVASAGFDVIPVPVYYPEVTEILGRPVYRRLVDVPGPIDLVDVFRRPEHIPSTSTTCSPRSRGRCGCSPASGTTQSPKPSPARGSTSYRTTV